MKTEESIKQETKRFCLCGCGEEVKGYNHHTWPFQPARFKKGHSSREQYHHNWKGGTTITNYGYRRVRSPAHPKADKDGYVLEHILVMEQKLGRYLQSHEIVHHKDGNRLNNSKDNLELMTRAQHTSHHRYYKTLDIHKRECVRCKRGSDKIKPDRWYRTENKDEFLCVYCYNKDHKTRRVG
jgi:hypothetical protein